MTRSEDCFAAAQRHIPGGVNSPVRAFRAVGGTPVFFARAQGPWLEDVDGNRYLDYVQSWGPMILGHGHPAVLDAIRAQLDRGLGFGAPTELETRMADALCARVPGLELVRMVNSGTEATMSAIRLARAATGRDRILKFEGCYHGHADALLVKAGSGALTLGVPSSPGVPAALAAHTLTLDYNDAGQVEDLFAREGETIAAIIVEPVAGNMNCVPPLPGFLETLRRVCDRHGALLIFDEVQTGLGRTGAPPRTRVGSVLDPHDVVSLGGEGPSAQRFSVGGWHAGPMHVVDLDRPAHATASGPRADVEKRCESSVQALNSSALPEGSRKKKVACSPAAEPLRARATTSSPP